MLSLTNFQERTQEPCFLLYIVGAYSEGVMWYMHTLNTYEDHNIYGYFWLCFVFTNVFVQTRATIHCDQSSRFGIEAYVILTPQNIEEPWKCVCPYYILCLTNTDFGNHYYLLVKCFRFAFVIIGERWVYMFLTNIEIKKKKHTSATQKHTYHMRYIKLIGNLRINLDWIQFITTTFCRCWSVRSGRRW